jgi:dTDP-4-amino-4,6-dideoxygalactose transaminase
VIQMAESQSSWHIPYHVPSIGREEVAAVTETLLSGWLTTGPKASLFESELAAYTGAKHAVAVNSCTAGLHLSLLALGVGPGDEVITTPYTFAATGETIVHTGARPVFVDVESGGFNIDPQKIAAAITPKTKAIVPVHIAGDPCNMKAIMALSRHHGIPVVEDAAHALGAVDEGRPIGSIGTMTVFSFYATKNLTTGEGGMITTNLEPLAQSVRQLSLHGLSRDAWTRYGAKGTWRYEICELGYKYNLSDIQAAIGLAQLRKFSAMQARRLRLVEAYQEGLANIPDLILPAERENTSHAWHLYIIRLGENRTPAERDELIEELKRLGIGVSVHFIPLHLHRYYQRTCSYGPGDFPEAEKQYFAAISLPLYPALKLEEVGYVCRMLRHLLNKPAQSLSRRGIRHHDKTIV